MKIVLPESNLNISSCYQCYTCSLGCPMSDSMDLLPHQIVRLVQLGKRDEILHSRTVWKCLNCETCVTRCPRGVDIPQLIDSLRHEYFKMSERRIPVSRFHELFMEGIRQNGIQFELGLLLRLKLATMDLFSDLMLGMRMLLKGKLNFIPHRTRDMLAIKNMFNKMTENVQ